ncbi:hypothetical protein ED728_RS22270 [Escherichia coli]
MMSASLEDVKDFKFILDEAVRINKELTSSSNFMEFYKKEYNGNFGSLGMTIDAPYELIKGRTDLSRTQIHLSYASYEKLYAISARFIKSNRLEMLVTTDEFLSNLKKMLFMHIWVENGSCDRSGCTILLNKTLKLTRREMSEEDFYYPILAHGLERDIMSIGRVDIISAEKMHLTISDDFTEQQLDLAKKFCSSHKFHYKHYLKIPVSKRSKLSRQRIAKNIACFVVGILQLFGVHYNISPYFLSISTDPYPNYDGFYLSKKPNEMFNYHYSTKGTIANSGEFWNKFEDDYKSDLGLVLSRLIELAIEPHENSVIADRLIDAIYLFSSAQQDKDESSRIVKLTTALERMVSLSSEKKDSSTTKNFVSRVSSLVSIYYQDEKKWARVAQEMYKTRSDIAHGSWSVYRGVEPLYSSKYNELTCRAIFSACVGFYNQNFTTVNKDNFVKAFFDSLEDIADKMKS